jgi:hypothetical protein
MQMPPFATGHRPPGDAVAQPSTPTHVHPHGENATLQAELNRLDASLEFNDSPAMDTTGFERRRSKTL